jgi:uncharacterized protein YodC (DUF2158 family)
MADDSQPAPPIRKDQDATSKGPETGDAAPSPRAGDVVKLPLQNAPEMVVCEHTTAGDVRCRWFDDEGTLREGVFRAAELRGVENKGPAELKSPKGKGK